MDNNVKKLEEVSASITKLINSNLMEQALVSNELEFMLGTIKYKVHKPTFAQRQEVYKKQSAKYLELLKDNSFAFEADLVKLYKSRGIDAEVIDKEITHLNKRKEDLLYKLGEAIKELKVADNELERMKKEIEDVNASLHKLLAKRGGLFETSIETQIQVFVYSYLTYLVTERYEEGKTLEDGTIEPGKWVKAWDKYEDFTNSTERVVNQVLFYASLLIKNEVEL